MGQDTLPKWHNKMSGVWDEGYDAGLKSKPINFLRDTDASFLRGYIVGQADRFALETLDRAERVGGPVQTKPLRSDLRPAEKATKRDLDWAFRLGWRGCDLPDGESEEIKRAYWGGVQLIHAQRKSYG